MRHLPTPWETYACICMHMHMHMHVHTYICTHAHARPFTHMQVALGLLSTPYVVFMIPVVTNWLTTTRPTAYDKAGKCVPKLPPQAVNQRFEEQQASENKARAERFAEGTSTCSDKWVKMLGTYDDDQLLEEELQEELGLGSGELAERKKAMKEAEQLNASAKKVMNEDELAMDEMKTEAKRAFAKK